MNIFLSNTLFSTAPALHNILSQSFAEQVDTTMIFFSRYMSDQKDLFFGGRPTSAPYKFQNTPQIDPPSPDAPPPPSHHLHALASIRDIPQREFLRVRVIDRELEGLPLQKRHVHAPQGIIHQSDEERKKKERVSVPVISCRSCGPSL